MTRRALRAAFWALLLSAAPARAHEFRLPDYRSATLPNGMRVCLVPNRELPLVFFELSILSGSGADPAGREGLAALTQTMLLRGAGRRSAFQIADAIQSAGGAIRGDMAVDRSALKLEVLRGDIPLAVEILSDLAMRPTFPEPEFRKARDLAIARLRRMDEDLDAVAGREFAPFLLGEHPYAHPIPGRPGSVGAIRLRDVREFHAAHVRPRNALLVAAGDFEPEPLLERIAAAFGAWSGPGDPPAQAPPAPRSEGGRILLLDRPDATEVALRIGGIAYGAGDPREAAADVLNAALGGGFSSRLVNSVRVEKGLVYSIGSSFRPMRGTGAFTIRTSTRVEALGDTLGTTLGILREVASAGLAAGEVEAARSFVLGQWPLRLETNEGLAEMVTRIESYGLGREDPDGYGGRVRAVTPEAAREAAALWVDPARLVIVAAGPAARIRQILEGYGNVTLRPASAPAAGGPRSR